MTDKEIYKSAVDFLLSFDSVSKTDLDKHLVSEFEKPNDLKIIYKKLCESAQNKQMSAKVIGNSIGGIENLKFVLFDFDPHKVAANFSKTDSEKLLNKIRQKLKPTGQIRTTNRSLWPQYCQSVIESAHFLKSFDTAEKFYKWSDFFANDSKSKPALPLMISIEISGIGFPLACDFLKELGFEEYGKPDVHLKDIFKALGIIDPNEKSVTKQDYATLKAIDRIAKANNLTSYAVDKVFWLIGSGNFYLTNKNIGRQKQEFIKKIMN
ncbi:hypothetical protein [Marinifilum fragile]|uniref:hypothetical protein n=1 Tax=Marinifilum fragile TaxID=570161 RepID=UPI0006D12383|nr:hypothetical protein [Marinifilum fragile]